MSGPLTIAVTGLNASDNPAPGVGVLRSLQLDAPCGQRLVGLAYDALDAGIYAGSLVQDVFVLPYPSSSIDAFITRLAYVHEEVGIDVIVPTLDAELPAFITLAPRLRSMGIGVLLPTREQFDMRSKATLAALGRKADIDVPEGMTVACLEDLRRVEARIPYPFLVKGVFYGAKVVHSFEEAAEAFRRALIEWGAPVIVQAMVRGEELNLVGLGNGEGGLVGAVGMKKLLITDKGKGWAGITIVDPGLRSVAERFVRATCWRGPFEVEVIRDGAGRYQLLEINPRFPAWCHLASSAGMNLPRAAVEMAAGACPAALHDYAVGTLFVRIAIDQIATLADFERILTAGEIRRDPPADTRSPSFIRGAA